MEYVSKIWNLMTKEFKLLRLCLFLPRNIMIQWAVRYKLKFFAFVLFLGGSIL